VTDEKAQLPKPAPEPGVLITKGMRVGIPIGGLQVKVGEDGRVEASLQLHTELDLCHFWLTIGATHVREANRARNMLSAAKQVHDDDGLSQALETEFAAGMEAMMAAAVAIDAFYASIKERSPVPPEISKAWQKNKTARYSQIAEVFRMAFHLPAEPDSGQIRKILKEVFRFRDLAVHPPAGTAAPAVHPDLNQASDWRYAAFCFHNAKESMRMALNVVTELASKACRGVASPVRSYCESLQVLARPIVDAWEAEFGPINPDVTPRDKNA
jgi:hypothetical protein